MSVPGKRKSRSAARTKRSHLALKKKTLAACSNCQKKILPHHACPFCGYYKGKEAIHIKLKKEKGKEKKKGSKSGKKEKK